MNEKKQMCFCSRLAVVLLPLIIVVLLYLLYALYDYMYFTKPFYESIHKNSSFGTESFKTVPVQGLTDESKLKVETTKPEEKASDNLEEKSNKKEKTEK